MYCIPVFLLIPCSSVDARVPVQEASTNTEADPELVYKELASVRAVLEIREAEVRRLRRRLDHSLLQPEVAAKVTQTQAEVAEDTRQELCRSPMAVRGRFVQLNYFPPDSPCIFKRLN